MSFLPLFLVTLDKALKSVQLERANATNLISAFVNQVEAYIDREILTQAEGDSTLDIGQQAINALS